MNRNIKKQTLTMICATAAMAVAAMTTMEIAPLAIAAPKKIAVKKAAAAPKEIKLGKATWRKLSLFLSNFSEVGVASFKQGHLSNAAMIEFGVEHRWRNGSLQGRIDAKRVQSATQWYFGRTITHASVPPYIRYKNGYYYNDFGVGDPVPFSQIYKLMDLRNGTYRAYFYIYETHDANPYGNYSPAKNAKTDDLMNSAHYIGKGAALIKPVEKGARRHYLLLEYSRVIVP